MERQKLPVSLLFSSGASVRTLPSDSDLPIPSPPGCYLSPPFLPMHLLSLSRIYFFSHLLFPPTIPLPQNTLMVLPSLFLLPAAVGIQMRLEFLQRMFWAATQQVGVMVTGLGRGQRTRQHSRGEEGLLLSDVLSQLPHCLSGHLLGPLSALLDNLLLCCSQLPVPLPAASVSGPAFPTQCSLSA